MNISKPVYTLVINAASTNITTATPVQIAASVPFAPSELQAYNGSTQPITLFAGPTGVKKIPYTIAPGLSVPVPMTEEIGALDVLKAQAFSADVTTGFLILNFYG